MSKLHPSWSQFQKPKGQLFGDLTKEEIMKKVDTLMRYPMVIATLSSFADNLEEEEAIMGFIDKDNNLEEVNLIENEVQPGEEKKFMLKLQQNSDIWQIFCIRQPKSI
ncbi:hypothetical protein BpHYR1_002051 [Brachionus plicatilis]|uniref:Uncharacterized protein n=1 Tax=Brachionus plicatilis TaxID=10195 RepID=A0A3M7QNG8_BRAPC|nr:hypothetical protein BpHYR1_002051 [Brachionus plicatilis]